ncbi:MAG: TauD/TfdA family dioxygenase [Acidimicrobiales bacterium]|nr:TauD/TfdA family dioxygenase [Acidimicrobiales bacterium]
MQRRPLCAHLGDEIEGLDLRSPVTETDAAELRAALAERHVLLFRGQHLEPADQLRALAVFGEPVDEGGDGARYVFVSNRRDDGVLAEGRRLLLHHDNAFTPEPLSAVGLYGEVVGEGGAPTCFANAERAASLLGADLRDDLTGAEALNLSGFAGGWYRYRDAETEPHHPRAVHPVLRPNPRSGGTALFVSEQQTDRILGWDPDRSEAVLTECFELLYADANLWYHHWAPGDLVIWDNQAVQHGRPAIEGPGERTLRRVAVVQGDTATQRAWTQVSLAAERAEREN